MCAEKVDVCLVNMPLAPFTTPNLALGLLQSILDDIGVSSKTIYANIDYHEFTRGGYDGLQILSLFGGVFEEWLFSSVAFPREETSVDEFIDELFRYSILARLNDKGKSSVKERIRNLHRHSLPFTELIVERLMSLSPKIVCCSSSLYQHTASLALLKMVKRLFPNVITVMGGASCESEMGFATHRDCEFVDIVVSGEADDLFAELVSLLLCRGIDVEPECLPMGVYAPCHRKENYSFIDGDFYPRALCASLDRIRIPNYDDYFDHINGSEHFAGRVFPGLLLEGSRGCWWAQHKACRFCGLNGKDARYRIKNHEKLLNEMNFLSERYGIRKFEMVDNIINLALFNTLLPALRLIGSPYTIFAEVPGNLGEKQVMALKDAGFDWLQAGIESLHTEILRLMQKGWEVWQSIRMLKYCLHNGIWVIWHILIDFPGEKDEWYDEMAELMPLLYHLQPPDSLINICFVRFSDYFRNPEEYGLKLVPKRLYGWVYPFGMERLKDMVYCYEDVHREEVSRSPELAVIFRRESVEKTDLVLSEWKRRFHGPDRPVLQLQESEEGIVIIDTRPCAVQARHELNGASALLYQSIMHGTTRADFERNAKDTAISEADIEKTRKKFIDDKIAIDVGDVLLGLAVPAGGREYVERTEYPGGRYSPN